jgi:hypothetical protein
MKKQMAASTAAISTPFFQKVSVVSDDRGLYVCSTEQETSSVTARSALCM